MYFPASFAVTDPDKLAEVIRQHSFATLITTAEGIPFATHLPILHRPVLGTPGVLVGHVACESALATLRQAHRIAGDLFRTARLRFAVVVARIPSDRQ